MKRYNPHGFTLIELVVTIAVIAVMAALAVPNLHNFMRSNRLTSQINSFVSALQLAKSEAIKRGTHVVVCASSDQQSCNTTQWQQGWIVFLDYPNPSTGLYSFSFTAQTIPTADKILRVGGKLSGGDTLHDWLSHHIGANAYGGIVFLPTGGTIVSASTTAYSGNTFTLCDPGTPPTPNLTNREKRALAVNVLISGLITLATDTNTPPDGIVNNYDTTTLTNISCL